MTSKPWGVAAAWNKALEQVEAKELEPRDYLWASELGKSPVDIWHRLKAVPATNPPNARSLRKFEAGNVFEWIVSLVLKRAGVLIEEQRYGTHQYEGLLKVTGKADFIVGGKVNRDAAMQTLEELDLPEVFKKGSEQVLKYLEGIGELEEMPIEIKSLSSFMFEALERTGNASKIHRLQLTHYLKSLGYPKGKVVYICRDDLRMMEVEVTLAGSEAEYKAFIEEMTAHMASDTPPPLEKPIVFDHDLGKFAKNFNVGYSSYLTLLYGFAAQIDFDEVMIPKVSRWNRVLNRMKNGDKMTAKNLEVLDEMRQEGFVPEDLVKSFAGENEEPLPTN